MNYMYAPISSILHNITHSWHAPAFHITKIPSWILFTLYYTLSHIAKVHGAALLSGIQ